MKYPKQKNIYQKLSTLLMLYALEQLNTQLAEEKLTEPLAIATQVLMFQGKKQVATIKDRTATLKTKEIIEASEALDYCNGDDTNAYDALETYATQVTQPLKGQTPDEYQKRKEEIKS
jgi:hypothetical protein